MIIKHYDLDFSRQPFRSPFGFKGSYLSEMWESRVNLTGEDGLAATGVGAQSVLWSDPELFSSRPEAVGNSYMLLTTALAAQRTVGVEWTTPLDLLDAILHDVHKEAQTLTGRRSRLRLTFTLNAMVALDNAAWLLMAKKRQQTCFDAIVPPDLGSAFNRQLEKVAIIPLISYGVTPQAIGQLLDDGCCLLKVKIGSDPDKNGNLDAMLEWDKKRLSEVHAIAESRPTPHTESGHVLYYLDANGRYDSLARLGELLDHARRIGALDRIIILEEPFPEELEIDVSSLPVRVAADESAHSVADVTRRIGLGYGAIALKPIAKTLSMSLRMLMEARRKGIPCFCADLTVTPRLVDWNKNMAARLAPLPGMKVGAMETNGAQNYCNWDKMMSQLPFPHARWVKPRNGIFELDDEFYRCGGGIFGN